MCMQDEGKQAMLSPTHCDVGRGGVGQELANRRTYLLKNNKCFCRAVYRLANSDSVWTFTELSITLIYVRQCAKRTTSMVNPRSTQSIGDTPPAAPANTVLYDFKWCHRPGGSGAHEHTEAGWGLVQLCPAMASA